MEVKVSFSLSKTTNKNRHVNSEMRQSPEKQKQEDSAILEFHPGGGTENKKELIIPLIAKNRWRIPDSKEKAFNLMGKDALDGAAAREIIQDAISVEQQRSNDDVIP